MQIQTEITNPTRIQHSSTTASLKPPNLETKLVFESKARRNPKSSALKFEQDREEEEDGLRDRGQE